MSKNFPNAEMYDFLPFALVLTPILGCTICCGCFGVEVVRNAKMYDLFLLLRSRSGALTLRCTICCCCFGLEVVPQCFDVRFVAVALVSKWCHNAKMYDFLLMYDLLPLL